MFQLEIKIGNGDKKKNAQQNISLLIMANSMFKVQTDIFLSIILE